MLENIYLYNTTFSKIPENTKIGYKNVKTFALTDMNENIDILLS
jgi:hypothetical protein